MNFRKYFSKIRRRVIIFVTLGVCGRSEAQDDATGGLNGKRKNDEYMKRIFLTLAAVALGMSAAAQSVTGGGLTEENLKEIAGSYRNTAADKALRNALAGTSIATLAVNSENAAMIDTHFSDRVKTKGITDQKSSGRCWLFTGLNVLRARMIEEYDLPEFHLSQNYVFFYDQIEKANLFLQGIIDTRALPDDDRQVD